MGCFRLVGALFALLAAPVMADETVALELHVSDLAAGDDVAVHLQLREREARAAPYSAERTVPGKTGLRIELPLPSSGTWELDVWAESYLREVRTFLAEKGTRVDLGRIVLRPSAWVTGQLDLGSIPVPTDAKLVVRYGPAAGEASQPEAATALCSMAGTRFRCEVPAARLDYSLRLPGFASRYFWDRPLAHRETTSLGSLRLIPGASLVGFVQVEPGVRFDAEKCRVTLERVPAGATEAVSPPSTQSAPLTGPRGFFQFTRLAAGVYDLTVRHAGLAPDRRRVVVHSTFEATLKSSVRLGPLGTLEIALSPPLDPYGSEWKVQVSTRAEGTEVTSVSGLADKTGICRFGLRRGASAHAMVETSRGERWAESRIQVDRPFVRHVLELSQFRVSGSVRLGNEPLAATLVFGGAHGSVSIPLTSDPTGQFEGLLPRLGPWRIEVRAESPPVLRNLDADLVAESDGESRVEISLEEGRIHGAVRDEQGNFVERSFLTLTPLGPKPDVSNKPSPDGAFDFRGLALGRYQLRAETSDAEGEETVEVTLEQQVKEVDVVVRKADTFRGRIVSPTAAGVPFATVQPLAFSPSARLFPRRTTTDEEGRFEIPVPKGADRGLLVVFAPGFAVRVVEFRGVPKERIEMPVDTLGGALTLRSPHAWGPVPLVRHRGAVFPVVLFDLAVGVEKRSETAGLTLRVPLVEAGDYTLCPGGEEAYAALVSGGEPSGCVMGFLGGSAGLTLDALPTSAR
ncbi:MAG: carboxypeptidase regulatory-like domain-containing protein [Acidobacteria bacterium]|nr:MAG: carboxypeptidase regulatory-like domain-containing protein [Acidobacteriota bacterium]MCE7956594.1 carboxypeptidase regulatory-like domain-containing protein [Acidobacteria bacterium ACB2]